VNDTFTFESRKVLLKDVPSVIRAGVSDVSPKESREEIEQYNRWAANHEHIMAKSLFSAGTTWPGVFLSDDRVALSVLGSRKEVDSDRLGCCGLSGGGLRSMMIGGMDERIKAAVCVGMMSTWRDLVLYHSFTHTWMMFVPHLPVEMDYPEIFALQMPAPRMVLNNTEDTLFDLGEMKRADTILKEVYQKAGFPENYMCEFYPGPHKFDAAMQKSAFSWLERWLKK
jgi:dienelactone hydrolase